MFKTITCATIFALSTTALAAIPAQARDYEPGRVDGIAATCRSLSTQSDDSFSVGTCLALEVENSTNEYSTLCAWAMQQELLGEEPIETVARCIDLLQSAED